MITNQRGAIYNRRRAAQLRDFSGLRLGNITPTDIDLYIEYKNAGHIIGELKHGDSELPFGQRLALERMCDGLSLTKPTIAFVASHMDDGDIDVAHAKIVEVRFRGSWHAREGETAETLINKFVEWIETKYLPLFGGEA